LRYTILANAYGPDADTGIQIKPTEPSGRHTKRFWQTEAERPDVNRRDSAERRHVLSDEFRDTIGQGVVKPTPSVATPILAMTIKYAIFIALMHLGMQLYTTLENRCRASRRPSS
jgi:hypothetical protein